MSSYLWPTSRGWMVVINAIAWYFVARINHNLIALLLSWTSFAFLAVSLLATFFSLRRIRFTRIQPQEAQVGRLVCLPVSCRNLKRRRRQAFTLSERLPFADAKHHSVMVPALRGHEEITIERSVMPIHRGEFHLDTLLARDTDPAGLFYHEEQIPLPASIVIYPQLFTIQNLFLPQHESFNASSAFTPTSMVGDSQDFYSVREYTHSDSIRFIDWKSSAKHSKYMVREFERNTSLCVAILLLADKAHTAVGNANLELVVSLAASVCQHVSTLFCNLSFASNCPYADYLPPREAAHRAPEILYKLACLTPSDAPLQHALDAFAPSLPPGSVVFCFTLDDTQDTQDAITALTMHGLNVRWYLAAPEDFEKRPFKHPQFLAPHTSSAIRLYPNMTPEQIFSYPHDRQH